MDLEIVPLTDQLVGAAAALLASVHAADGAGGPAVDLADVGVARSQLEACGAAGPAVAAVAGDGTLAGVMAATLTGLPEHPRARIRLPHHAAAPRGARLTYRHLYRDLSRRLADIGCFEHTVAVAAGHSDTVACLVELGFGMDQIKGLRPLTLPAAAAPQVRLRQAHPGDLQELLDLTVELQRFHAEAPILSPALADLSVLKDDLHAAITDDHRLVLVAEADGRAAGLMVADPDSRFLNAVTIGIAVVTSSARGTGVGTALLRGVLDWATRHGFGGCGAEWTSANLLSDAFWRGHGFTPARYTLTRRIDSRVAWANAALSHRASSRS